MGCAEESPPAAPTAEQPSVVPEPPAAPDPSSVGSEDGQRLGRTASALGRGSTDEAFRDWALYVADGTGIKAPAYTVMSELYGRFAGRATYIDGSQDTVFASDANELTRQFATAIYLDCYYARAAGRPLNVVIGGFSRGAHIALEGFKWASEYWGCGGTAKYTLLLDPVDTSVWGWNHSAPGISQTILIRKNWWANTWAFVFANAPIFAANLTVIEHDQGHFAFAQDWRSLEDMVRFANQRGPATLFR